MCRSAWVLNRHSSSRAILESIDCLIEDIGCLVSHCINPWRFVRQGQELHIIWIGIVKIIIPTKYVWRRLSGCLELELPQNWWNWSSRAPIGFNVGINNQLSTSCPSLRLIYVVGQDGSDSTGVPHDVWPWPWFHSYISLSIKKWMVSHRSTYLRGTKRSDSK